MTFKRGRLSIRPLNERVHDLQIDAIRTLEPVTHEFPPLKTVADRIIAAKRTGSAVILMMGGHVIRSGVQRYIIDLMERGYIGCLSMNGACMIHDFEFALIGATTESVARYIREGQFGLWSETGRINDIVNAGKGLGMGEAVGQAISGGDFRYKDISILAAAYRLNIPTTVHIGIGYDIIHEHPNFDGAASGEASYKDFLTFAAMVENLSGGVVMNFGSAVMAPEVFLKALSMCRNVAHQADREIKHFTCLVCDLADVPADFSREPGKDCAAYYFRPHKTMLIRTVSDGGESFYVRGRHADTIPALWTEVNKNEHL